MLGVIYLCLIFGVGYVVTNFCWPKLGEKTAVTFTGKKVNLAPGFLLFPVWFLTGTVLMVWVTYFCGYLFKSKENPMFYANLIAMPLAVIFIVLMLYVLYIKRKKTWERLFVEISLKEIFFIIGIVTLVMILMFWTFFVRNGKLYVGYSVFSDFAPHLGMIRSFSVGNNFPTEYSHFAGEDIKYHFLFQFLAGNLEYLGMRIDYAFNTPSVLSLVGAFFLLYALTVKLTGRRFTGYLACLFFAFRSSRALFDYLAAIPEGTNVKQALVDNTEFIGTTTNESWGLWNLNVYCNQRHLALGICCLLFLIYMLLDCVFLAARRVRFALADAEENMNGEHLLFFERFLVGAKCSVASRNGWEPRGLLGPIALGVLLGACSFFNGACVIACLSVLFILAFFADHRLEYAMVAVITVLMSLLESKFFIDGSVVSPQYMFGFLAANKTLFGALDYILTLCGILPLLLLAAWVLCNGTNKWIMCAFSAPFIVAFTLSLTTDVTVNHKYIMLSVMLLGIYAAIFVSWLWHRFGFWPKAVSLLLVVIMTATGIYDLTVIFKKNDSSQGRCVVLDLKDPVTLWIEENADSDDVFLTYYYSLNNVVMGGAMLYYGWPYYAWSAGYDTALRDTKAKEMFGAESVEVLDALIKENEIRFVVIDDELRNSDEFGLNEQTFIDAYECVFTSGQLSIYDTQKRLFE